MVEKLVLLTNTVQSIKFKQTLFNDVKYSTIEQCLSVKNTNQKIVYLNWAILGLFLIYFRFFKFQYNVTTSWLSVSSHNHLFPSALYTSSS